MNDSNPDLLSAASVLAGTPAPYPPAAPQIARVLGVCTSCSGACSSSDELCRTCSKVLVDEVTWLDRETAVVEWRFAHSGFATTSIVTVEFEGADPSVGLNGSYWYASSDGPAALDELVAEKAADRASDSYDERDCDEDGPGSWRDDDDRFSRFDDAGEVL